MTGAGSGGGGGYDYVETFYPDDAQEGESLYHLTEDAAFVYTGIEWTEQTVTDHSQLSGVNEGDHRSDSRVSALAPLQSVNGRTGDVTGLFEATDYNPEADTHSRYTDAEAEAAAPVQSRYTDAEAESAAPVQSVNGDTGDVDTFTPTVLKSGAVTGDDFGAGLIPTDLTWWTSGDDVVVGNEPNGSETVVYTGSPLPEVTVTITGGGSYTIYEF